MVGIFIYVFEMIWFNFFYMLNKIVFYNRVYFFDWFVDGYLSCFLVIIKKYIWVYGCVSVYVLWFEIFLLYD